MYKIPKDLLKRQQDALEKHFNNQKKLFQGISFESAVRSLRQANTLRRRALRQEKHIMKIIGR